MIIISFANSIKFNIILLYSKLNLIRFAKTNYNLYG